MKKDKSSDEITNASKVIEIRSRFKKLCESLHLNSKQLARLCGIADATIYRLEGRLSDHARITHTTLKRICEGTGANIDWLMGEVEEPMFIIEPDMLRVEDAEGSRQRLREYREKLGMTLEEFATHTKIDIATIKKIDSGSRKLSGVTAEKICKTCLDITPEWLLWGEEFPVNNRMINWLKKHEDERKRIWESILAESE